MVTFQVRVEATEYLLIVCYRSLERSYEAMKLTTKKDKKEGGAQGRVIIIYPFVS